MMFYKKILFSALFLGALTSLLSPSSSKAATQDLRQIFELAKTHYGSVQIQQSTLEQAKEQKKQTVGGLLPTISAVGTLTRQDMAHLRTSSSSIYSEQQVGKISVSQPLFQGLQEYYGLQATKANVVAKQEALNWSQNLLYVSAAEGYYQYLSTQKDVQFVERLVALTTQRVRELQRRVRIGQSRQGELYSAQAQLSQARAQLYQAKIDCKKAENQLSLLTGQNNFDLVDDNSLPQSVPSSTSYLSKLNDRPDIKEKVENYNVYDESVAVAKGSHLPTLDLSGNYYVKRTGSSEDVKWDATLTLTIPLFEGGVTQSKVREAAAQRKESELELELARKKAHKELQDLHAQVMSSIEQVETLKESSTLSEKNYEVQSKDFGLGLVTNLEVIQSLNMYIESKRTLNRMLYQAKTDLARLEAYSSVIR